MDQEEVIRKISEVNELLEIKSFEKALEECLALLSKNEQEYRLYFLLSKVYVRMHKIEEAVQARRQAMQLINDETKSWQSELDELISTDSEQGWYDKNVEQIDPAELLTPARLDIVVKYLYATYLQGERYDGDFAERLYKKHISHRSGGYEPSVLWNPNAVESPKGSVDTYIEKYKNLLTSMEKGKFDISKWVPISKVTNLILDGAHRVAACLFFNKKISVCKIPHFRGKKWDMAWFKENSFSSEECDLLARNFVRLKPNNVRLFVIWAPAEEHLSDISPYLGKKLQVFYDKTFNFDNVASFENFVLEVYSHQFGPDVVKKKNIVGKSKNLSKYPLKAKVCAVYGTDASNLQANVDAVKKNIRSALDEHVAEELFMTVHSTDGPEETTYFANYFFNENQIQHLKSYGDTKISPSFSEKLTQAKRVLEEKSVPLDMVSVVGSGVLVGSGIKKQCDDIDFIMDVSFRETRKYPAGKSFELERGVDVVKSNYHKRSGLKTYLTDDEIIYDKKNHFYHRGIKFSNLHIVADNKSVGRRQKDKKDYFNIYHHIVDSRHRKNDVNIKRMKKIKKLKEKPIQFFLDSKFSPFRKKK